MKMATKNLSRLASTYFWTLAKTVLRFILFCSRRESQLDLARVNAPNLFGGALKAIANRFS